MSAVLFGIGNPLLDLSLKTDAQILTKYKLDANKAYLSSPETLPLFDEIVKNPQLQKVPGGSSQNAIRAFQWLSPTPKSAGFTGSVADDPLGDAQRQLMLDAGIDVQYYVAKGERTGKCACLITGEKNDRCLIADIAAASSYDPAFVHNPTLKAALDKAKVVYAEGFFVDVSTEALLVLAHRCVSNGKAFALNLSADWVIGKCLAQILELLPFVSYLFCNEGEARALAGNLGWSLDGLRSTKADGSKGFEDILSIARRLALWPKVDGKPRVVIITQGKDDVVVARIRSDQYAALVALPAVAAAAEAAASLFTRDAAPEAVQITYSSPHDMAPGEFKDSNGCGDSFVGGFFASLLLKNSTLDEAVAFGILMAEHCGRHDGVQFGEKGSLHL